MFFLIIYCVYGRNYSLESSSLTLIGFLILIIGIFFCLNLSTSKRILKFSILSENVIKIILLTFMTIFIVIIPPISFSRVSIAWQELNALNIIRAIFVILGCAFLPGSCLYNLIFPRDFLPKRFKVNPLIIKMTIYPLISFSVLGILVLVLDQIGLNISSITYLVFILIVIIFFVDIIIQIIRKQGITNITKKYSISYQTLAILLLSFGLIMFSIGIMFEVKYLIPGDSWVILGHVNYIGLSEDTFSNSWVSDKQHPLFWAYPSFAISSLSGLPYINTNVLLTPFLYLFITSTYLFMKSVLKEYKNIYSIIAMVITVSFVGLLDIWNISNRNDKGNISNLIFDGIISLRYKSFSYFYFFASLSLFFILFSEKLIFEEEKKINYEKLKIYIIAAFFLVISYTIYMFPLLFGLVIIFLFCILISKNDKKESFTSFIFFISLLLLIFLILDISMCGYLSEIANARFFHFFRFLPNDYVELFIPEKTLVYLFILFLGILYSIYYGFYVLNDKKREKRRRGKLKKNLGLIKVIFISTLFIFSLFLIVHIYIIFNPEFSNDVNNDFLYYYLNYYFFPKIGITGILGIYLSYYSYKENRNLFLFLFLWIIFTLLFSSIIIFSNFLINFPIILTFEELIHTISNAEYNLMVYWFSRTWFYVIPAFALLLTLGLIHLSKKLKSFNFFKRNVYFNKLIKNMFICIFVVFSLTNLIIAGLYWQNLWYRVSDDQAQIIGWVNKNIPDHSTFLIDDYFDQHLIRTKDYDSFALNYAVRKAYYRYLENRDYWWYISYNYDFNCNISLVNEFKSHYDILKLEDENNKGHIEVQFNFNSPQKFGTIEYYVYSNGSYRLWGELSDRSIDGLHLWNGNFSYYDGNQYVQLQPYQINKWYHIILDFECSNGGYKGLNQYEWRVSINGTDYNNLKMLKEPSVIDSLRFNTAVTDSGWEIYLDVVNFSWYNEFEVEKFIFNIYYMEKYLSRYDISYFIHTEKETGYNFNVEKDYLNIEDLILNYFKEKLYEYGDYVVYSSIS